MRKRPDSRRITARGWRVIPQMPAGDVRFGSTMDPCRNSRGNWHAIIRPAIVLEIPGLARASIRMVENRQGGSFRRVFLEGCLEYASSRKALRRPKPRSNG
jgi:hypothetical protein